jgi:hypothetical protein
LGFVEQLPGEVDTSGLSDGDGGRAEVLFEETPQVAVTEAQADSQTFNVTAITVERAIGNEGQGAGDSVGRASPDS